MQRARFLARWMLAMVAVVALAACGSTTDDGGGGDGGGGATARAVLDPGAAAVELREPRDEREPHADAR